MRSSRNACVLQACGTERGKVEDAQNGERLKMPPYEQLSIFYRWTTNRPRTAKRFARAVANITASGGAERNVLLALFFRTRLAAPPLEAKNRLAEEQVAQGVTDSLVDERRRRQQPADRLLHRCIAVGVLYCVCRQENQKERKKGWLGERETRCERKRPGAGKGSNAFCQPWSGKKVPQERIIT